MTGDSEETIELLHRARAGESEAIGDLFERHRGRLLRMVEMRLDRRVRARIDPGDVLQESLLEATRRFSGYLAHPDLPFFVWLRFLTRQKLVDIHRHHLGLQNRDAQREVVLGGAELPGASSESLVDAVIQEQTTPSQAAVRGELRVRLQKLLDGMQRTDREILVLRRFEQLSNEEAAAELGLEPSAASKRFLRALQRFKQILEGTLGAG